MSGVDEADDRYVVGVDYGTLSGRALVVRVRDGAELGTAVHEYRNAVISSALPDDGTPLPPDWALQDPQDYRDVLRYAVPAAVAAAGIDPGDVVGVGIDFTACTVLPTLADGTPLCEVPELRQRPHSWVKLWKHHAAQPHADRINAIAHERREPWIGRYGGKISAEWQFAKGLQILEEDPEVYRRAERFIEAADWIVWQLCGVETRNVCTAGYKGIMQDGKYPSVDYLTALNPAFGDFVAKLDGPLMPLGAKAGELAPHAASWTGLPAGIAVAVGNVDAHVTAASAQALNPGRLVAIMGTSTCHVVNGNHPAEVSGMCGVVDGGISAGAWGYEAGQSGVGDIFGWFVKHAAPAGTDSHERLTELAAAQPVGAHGLVALDWWNGNRSLLVNHDLSGMIIGLTLATRPEDIYRALLEATAYGTRMIIEAFVEAGVKVDDLVIAGGLTSNELLMQIYADVTNRPLGIIGSAQGPALGSAIHAAVAAGVHPSIQEAAQAMGRVREAVYRPDPDRVRAYDALYAEYRTLHDHFGRGANDVMLRLRAIRNTAVEQAAARKGASA
ncbi:L-ribulokinase [Micromonospora phaseoli]|uniref:Ribulokinase n=1 Tax=Micromonospora phaseoli TaxID=1144548 RepID=A0A1H6URJ2_9ACTN|nr:ribulokinase [Micromonospora phaseoli]PZV99068.1 L-ribulokinase [Micromonospora phaseoli]GIJ78731.1 ribulokinase [Micromonospora phaseoli]SEI93324.1 L-ribulokinase [Micromonospora phaseoli]